jgi:hypothetical protein
METAERKFVVFAQAKTSAFALKTLDSRRGDQFSRFFAGGQSREYTGFFRNSFGS